MIEIALPTRKFTVEEYHKMAEVGLFHNGDRLELIKGEIIEMSPVGFKHASCVKKLNYLFSERLGDKVIIGVQDPIKLKDNSEPQPDLVLLKPRADFYSTQHPQPEDILLLIEVADSSIDYDRNVKIPLYAENKIQEVWLVNLNQYCLEVYQKPYQNYYQNMQKLSEKDSITLTNFKNTIIQVINLF